MFTEKKKPHETEHGCTQFADSTHAQIKEPAAAYNAVVNNDERKTIRDFYAMPEDWKGELIDGVLYAMSSPRILHQMLSVEIGRQLTDYVREHNGDCIVIPMPLDTQLDCDDYTMLEPDITVTCDRSRIKNGILFGAPDFVIEILSPSTAHRVRFLKLQKYMNAGVREYWIVDPKAKTVTVYVPAADKTPMHYTFSGKVPVAIWDNDCKVDFSLIMKNIGFLYHPEHM